MLTLHLYHLSPCNEKIRRMLNLKGISSAENYRELMRQMAATSFNRAAP
jgi:hypothetical protein